ncbi:unnamed protein product [Oikopleura dioica]|uniref:Uncharacterized protein n=1 Tax=Oikopleura dioica TaxID=34765 RepID=E4X4N6_OIKDI|nr:unnamed protein product [Oikopleura dioica]
MRIFNEFLKKMNLFDVLVDFGHTLVNLTDLLLNASLLGGDFCSRGVQEYRYFRANCCQIIWV